MKSKKIRIISFLILLIGSIVTSFGIIMIHNYIISFRKGNILLEKNIIENENYEYTDIIVQETGMVRFELRLDLLCYDHIRTENGYSEKFSIPYQLEIINNNVGIINEKSEISTEQSLQRVKYIKTSKHVGNNSQTKTKFTNYIYKFLADKNDNISFSISLHEDNQFNTILQNSQLVIRDNTIESEFINIFLGPLLGFLGFVIIILGVLLMIKPQLIKLI